MQILRHWIGGVRLYLAIATLMISGQAWWWAATAYRGAPDLIAARLHEVYGWLSLAMLAATLAIGPAYKLLPNLGGAGVMRDARRILGISAAWFAVLHAGVAYYISFQAVNLFEISNPYGQAFALGGAALVILLAMAVTSFDAAMRHMGRWWFRLHRLVYLAVALAVWHAFMVGVHAASLTALAILVGSALLMFVSHLCVAWRQGNSSILQITTLAGLFLLIVTLSNYGIQQYIDANILQGHGHR